MKNLLIILISLFMLSIVSCEKSTPADLPVITYTSNYQTSTTLYLYCAIEEGESANFITNYGVCYSETPDPTIDDSHKDFGSGTWNGYLLFKTNNLSGEYYFKIYAVNANGVSYGPNITVII